MSDSILSPVQKNRFNLQNGCLGFLFKVASGAETLIFFLMIGIMHPDTLRPSRPAAECLPVEMLQCEAGKRRRFDVEPLESHTQES